MRIPNAPTFVLPPKPAAIESAHKVSSLEFEALLPNVRQNSFEYESPPAIEFDCPSIRYTSPQTILSRRSRMESRVFDRTITLKPYSDNSAWSRVTKENDAPSVE